MKRMLKCMLIVMLFVCIVITFTGCGKKEETTANEVSTQEKGETQGEAAKELSMGEWSNNVYANDFLGLKFKLPEGWEYSNDEEIAEMMDLGKELLNDDQKKLAEISKLNTVYYMVAQNATTGDNISIMSEKLTSSVTTDYYITALKTQLEAVNTIDYTITGTSKQTIANREYDVLTTKASISGVDMIQNYYLYKLDNYMVVIIATSVSGESGITNMINSFE